MAKKDTDANAPLDATDEAILREVRDLYDKVDPPPANLTAEVKARLDKQRKGS